MINLMWIDDYIERHNELRMANLDSVSQLRRSIEAFQSNQLAIEAFEDANSADRLLNSVEHPIALTIDVLIQDKVPLTRPHIAILEDAERQSQVFRHISEPGRRFARMVKEALQSQEAVRSSIGASYISEMDSILSRQYHDLQKILGSTAHEIFAASASANRVEMLFPEMATAWSSFIDPLRKSQLDTVAVRRSEFDAWASKLDLLVLQLQAASDATKETIDLRALLQFFKDWMYPWIVTIVAAYALLPSDEQNSEQSERTESQFENHISEDPGSYRDLRSMFEDQIEIMYTVIERLQAEADDRRTGAIYIVIRPVHLSQYRRYHTGHIAFLLPGQEVEVVEERQKWLRVRAYDFETGEFAVGWVLKKYLRRLVGPPPANSE